jgi:hypothetical protein
MDSSAVLPQRIGLGFRCVNPDAAHAVVAFEDSDRVAAADEFTGRDQACCAGTYYSYVHGRYLGSFG